jgi:hypothetical protein
MLPAQPDREAVVCGSTRRTFGERAAGRAAGPSGAKAGLRRIDLTNRVEYLETFYAPEDRRRPERQLPLRHRGDPYLLDDSDAQVVVTEAAYVKDVRKAAKYPPRARGEAHALRPRDRRRHSGPRRRLTTGGSGWW